MDDEKILEITNEEEQRIRCLENDSVFGKHLWNYYQFVSWARW